MKTFRLLLLTFMLFIWLLLLYLLVEALTIPSSNNALWPYRYIIGITFITTTAFFRRFYKRWKRNK